MGKETADLFGWVPPAGYPVTPGSAPVDTSQEAADQVGPQAPKLRERCLQALRQYPEGLTADEVATELRCHILTIRPRMTELKAMGKIRDSGRRRHNLSGRRAAVMVLA